jgi:hypothetical protein
MSVEPEPMTPDTSTPREAAESPESAPPPASQAVPPKRWQGKLLTVCFAVFSFEVGLFLVIFPWQESWTLNYFQGLSPAVENLWDEPSFRGLITGLGFVNIYIALLQLARLFRPGTK